MKRRIPILTSWSGPPGPALAAFVAASALGVYLYPWQEARELPACDAGRIQSEVQTKFLVSATHHDGVSGAGSSEFDDFRELHAVEVKGIIYERACTTTMLLDQGRAEIRFQILKAANAAGYRISLLDT